MFLYHHKIGVPIFKKVRKEMSLGVTEIVTIPGVNVELRHCC